MINNNGGQHTVLDRITRITPIRADRRLAPTRTRRPVDVCLLEFRTHGLLAYGH